MKQPSQHTRADTQHFDDSDWSLAMAVAWVAFRTSAAVEAASRGHGKLDRSAVERLIKELKAGRLTAWGTTDSSVFPISVQHWHALEPTFARKRFMPGFIETFGRLVTTVKDGEAGRPVRRVTISSVTLQQMFPVPDAAIAPSATGRTQPQRERAKLGLRGRFGDNIPSINEMNNHTLYKEVTEWLAKNKPLPKGYREISKESVLRAAGRKV